MREPKWVMREQILRFLATGARSRFSDILVAIQADLVARKPEVE